MCNCSCGWPCVWPVLPFQYRCNIEEREIIRIALICIHCSGRIFILFNDKRHLNDFCFKCSFCAQMILDLDSIVALAFMLIHLICNGEINRRMMSRLQMQSKYHKLFLLFFAGAQLQNNLHQRINWPFTCVINRENQEQKPHNHLKIVHRSAH